MSLRLGAVAAVLFFSVLVVWSVVFVGSLSCFPSSIHGSESSKLRSGTNRSEVNGPFHRRSDTASTLAEVQKAIESIVLPPQQSLFELAIGATLWEPKAPLRADLCALNATAAGPACGQPNVTRRLLFAMLFGFETDTLEIVLEQTRGVGDVLLAESAQIHNPRNRAKNYSKPLLWRDRLSTSSRFGHYDHVDSIVCGPTGERGLWDAEESQNSCLADAVRERVDRYDLVVVGSTDEILGRDALLRLKHCKLPPELPTSSAIGMPMGLLGRRFKPDWHYRHLPYSFSLPTIYPAEKNQKFKRSFEPIPGSTAVVGGLHLTNYCSLPWIVLKELTCTECERNEEQLVNDLCSSTPSQFKQKYCYDRWKKRISAGVGDESVTPCALEKSKERYPAWVNGPDEREGRFYGMLCAKGKVSKLRATANELVGLLGQPE